MAKTEELPALPIGTIESWLLNPLPDIALQDLGLCILRRAFDMFPILNDPDRFIQVPYRGVTTKWDWDAIDVDKLEAKMHNTTGSITALTNEDEVDRITQDIGSRLAGALTSSEGILMQSVRLHVSPTVHNDDDLLYSLVWIGEKDHV